MGCYLEFPLTLDSHALSVFMEMKLPNHSHKIIGFKGYYKDNHRGEMYHVHENFDGLG